MKLLKTIHNTRFINLDTADSIGKCLGFNNNFFYRDINWNLTRKDTCTCNIKYYL